MRYVFFDIECADGGKGSICSFGYVITDTDFNVLQKRDIIINPDARFYLAGKSKKAELVLAYSKAEFRKAPKFPKYYHEIRALLEAKDQIVVGHSVRDDAGFLCKSCQRYSLPCVNFAFTDSQRIYANYADCKEQVSLDRACEAFGIGKSHTIHKSDEDAFATMQLVREICQATGIALSDYHEKCKCSGEVKDFAITCDYIRPKHHAELDAEGYRILPPGKENCIWHGTKNEAMFLAFLKERSTIIPVANILGGKKICISLNYERSHYREMLILVQKITSLGGKYTMKASACDIFVSVNAKNRRGKEKVCYRLIAVNEVKAKGAEIEILSLDEFLPMIGLSREELKRLAEPNI